MQYFALAAVAGAVSAWDLTPSALNVWQGHTGQDARGGQYFFEDLSGNTWANGTGSCTLNTLAEWSDAEIFSAGEFYVNFNNGALNFYNLREQEITDFNLVVYGSDLEVAYSNSTADYSAALSCDNSTPLADGDLVLGNFPNIVQQVDADGNVSGRGNIAAFNGVWPASFNMLWPGVTEMFFDDQRVISEAIADVDGGFTVIADTVASNELWFNYTTDASLFRSSYEINLA